LCRSSTALPKHSHAAGDTVSASTSCLLILTDDMVGISSELEVEVGPAYLLQKITVGCNPSCFKSSVPDLTGLLDHQSDLYWKILLQIPIS